MSYAEVDGSAASSGLRERLLAGAGSSIDRLPLLRAVFRDAAQRLEDALRGISRSSTAFSVEAITSARGADLSLSFERCALTAVYDGAEPDSRIVLGVDRAFAFTLVEALFGGEGSEPPHEEDRELSNVETRVGQYVFGRLTKALRESFFSVADIAFPMEEARGKLDLASGGRKGASAMLCRCRLAAFDREGTLLLAIPQSLLEAHRETLSRDPSVEAPLLDPEWAKRMQDRVTQTEVTVQAVMEKPGLTLADIARFEIGQIVELPFSPSSLIKLECEGQPLYWCELGQKNGVYTIRIEDIVDQEQEFIDDMLGG